jgi:hypothetical protein
MALSSISLANGVAAHANEVVTFPSLDGFLKQAALPPRCVVYF